MSYPFIYFNFTPSLLLDELKELDSVRESMGNDANHIFCLYDKDISFSKCYLTNETSLVPYILDFSMENNVKLSDLFDELSICYVDGNYVEEIDAKDKMHQITTKEQLEGFIELISGRLLNLMRKNEVIKLKHVYSALNMIISTENDIPITNNAVEMIIKDLFNNDASTTEFTSGEIYYLDRSKMQDFISGSDDSDCLVCIKKEDYDYIYNDHDDEGGLIFPVNYMEKLASRLKIN